ncbi:MAG: UPF0149 family protein [Ectothiorhodospiraceae bacterium]|nr:UPF0149 family protein [Ectothiorhodospiraceae bacterium]
MPMTVSSALSDDELDLLQELLRSEVVPQTAMQLSAFDGYLTAIALNPDLIPPSRWLPWLWDLEEGAAAPEFQDMAQAEQMMGLVLRHYNDVMTAVNAGRPAPLFAADDEDRLRVDLWAGGFVLGFQLFGEQWLKQLLDEQPEMLATILLFGTDLGEESLSEHPEDIDAIMEQAPDRIQAALEDLCDYFAAHREQAARDRIATHRRAEPKVGRNDPCPCGSGRKYKKCCGADSQLH